MKKVFTHFVGFRGEEYFRAQKVFGPPDMIHRVNDRRLWTDVSTTDLVVFANGSEHKLHEYSFNDSRYF